MAESDQARLHSLHADLCAGARQRREPAPREQDVDALASLLREGAEAAVPKDLVPSLRAALQEAGARSIPRPAQQPRISPRAILRLLWAEARFLPLSFFVLQAALLAAAFLANRYLTGFAGPRVPVTWAENGPAGDLVTRAVLRGALGRSVDAVTLVAPWLGVVVVLFAALPGRRDLWACLEALSPFSSATRLLARVAAATLAATAALLGLGLAQAGPAAPPAGVSAALVVARSAPLFLAVSWALAWSIPFGAPGGAAASLVLWGGLTCGGGGLGRWDLFAPVDTIGAAPAQALAFSAAAALFALAWAQARQLEPRMGGRLL